MGSITDKLISQNKISPPNFIKNNVHFEVQMGSVAYGCSNDHSDIDIYGFCIPPKDVIFPHLKGIIHGFGRQVQEFNQFQQHHIKCDEKEYDISIFNIVRYFQLAFENIPNVLDSLFVPRRCILHSTLVGEKIRENRHLFLSKKAFYSMKGYAYSQLKKAKEKYAVSFVEFCQKYNFPLTLTNEELNESGLNVDIIKNGHFLISKIEQSGPRTKRLESIAKFGFDPKFLYHVVRLVLQAEQILMECDLDLEKNKEQLKAVRRGEWSLIQIEEFFTDKEKQLESLYVTSTTRYSPDEQIIKSLLLECLGMHYENLNDCIVDVDMSVTALREIQKITDSVLSIIK